MALSGMFGHLVPPPHPPLGLQQSALPGTSPGLGGVLGVPLRADDEQYETRTVEICMKKGEWRMFDQYGPITIQKGACNSA